MNDDGNRTNRGKNFEHTGGLDHGVWGADANAAVTARVGKQDGFLVCKEERVARGASAVVLHKKNVASPERGESDKRKQKGGFGTGKSRLECLGKVQTSLCQPSSPAGRRQR